MSEYWLVDVSEATTHTKRVKVYAPNADEAQSRALSAAVQPGGLSVGAEGEGRETSFERKARVVCRASEPPPTVLVLGGPEGNVDYNPRW